MNSKQIRCIGRIGQKNMMVPDILTSKLFEFALDFRVENLIGVPF